MIIRKKGPLALLLLAITVSGCSWIENFDRRQRYLVAEVQPGVTIPDGLDQPPFVDALDIPEVIDSRGIAGKPLDVGLPEAISTTFGVEQIVLKRLGESRWIFLDVPPSSVWPKILRFMEQSNLNIQRADPSRGIIETIWITSMEGDPEKVFEGLVTGSGWTKAEATIQSKFKITIEPGIRSGSSEVYLEQTQLPLNSPVRPDFANWDGVSDDQGLENEVLTKLAYALGETINDPVFSIGATALQGKKAELVPDRVRPVLMYKLGFDRAWATVGGALKNARIQVEDLDRSSQTYYVYYDESIDRDPGFFSRLFSGDKEKEKDDQHRLLVHLDTKKDEVLVTVLKDTSTPADSQIAERLLSIIKESST